jgi:hypothetical protein
MIVSKRRLAANNRNASFSTGPKTTQGKLVSRNNALRHGLARPVASDSVAAKAIEALTAILAGSRNDSWYRELARNVAESFFDHVRIRTVRSQIFYNLGEFENADPGKNASAANQLERIWRYEQRVLAKRRKALRAFRDAGAFT